MTADDRKFLSRINKYKENLKKDMGPQKVQMPAQLLDKLRPKSARRTRTTPPLWQR